MTYVVADFTSRENLFAAVTASRSRDVKLDEGWGASFAGVMHYRALTALAPVEQGRKHQKLRVRMIAIDLEDPVCGSGCCALRAYLALQDGEHAGSYSFQFSQSSGIGRDSSICVEVTLDQAGKSISRVLECLHCHSTGYG